MVMAILVTLNKVVTVLTAFKQGPAGPSGGQGATGSAGVQLVTTSKLPIINKQCELPSTPLGGVLVFNMARVFWLIQGEEVMGELESVKVMGTTLHFLDSQVDLTGCKAMVSYLTLS